MNKTALIIITLGLAFALGFIFLGGSDTQSSVQNVEIKNGVQYVTIDAKGGYSPRKTTAKAGVPTKLIVNTKDTYDCSAALVIKSLNYQKILPQNGETEIDLGVKKAGETLQGLCSMGMYNFKIKFE
ncbi:hypothetical protein A3A05_02420 [Candidatus Nomurabacteria bacterium RIFCSPLOWO2_01_FULL_41_12]|uniref:EfeO-type cupredoxin-like domain-containing protein n=1 Tax=Candidatus Nomurabacteria bacterium RIFCSPLOWO2_01_FULL_41_12 TaxID=1801774 RepID=A0A1F6WUK3_9BACT|nr:MAG: hypothetical protein A2732_00265 [Candidatus Nomurabacteria bacterium RIFCSPHIGHO2_01_FULL_40_10]OGI85561.1 MAG: hypothetical protein A3A05_02420 [Candidatus Nomurabacteria bacterium RIFCSPLOWO2_01_FULL_41_12]